MPDQTHVVDIDVRIFSFGHHHRIVPEVEIINAVGAFGDCEEGFAVPSLDAGHDQDFAIQLDGAGIEGGIDAQPLHQEGIALGIEVVAPEKGGMTGRQHWIGVTLIDAVMPGQGRVAALDIGFVISGQPGQPFGKRFHLHHLLLDRIIAINRGCVFSTFLPAAPAQGRCGCCDRGISTQISCAAADPRCARHPPCKTTHRGCGRSDVPR